MEPQKQQDAGICPKCGNPLVLATTKTGKRLKKCSTNKWDPETRMASGCDYVEWMKGTTEETDELCPICSSKVVIYTSAAGKRLKKCSTNTWNPQTKSAEGCTYMQWL